MTMIVKKISYTNFSKTKARRIGDLVDYIRQPHDRNPEEKVAYAGAKNFTATTHEGQRVEMISLAERSKKSRMPVSHWIFSWREGEQPTPQQVDRLVDIFLREMGLEGHQCIYALHHNTDNFRVHIAVNRMSPALMKVLQPNKGFDREVGHRIVALVEHEQGWAGEKNARYTVTEDGEVTRVKRDNIVQPSATARTFEHLTGEASAQRLAQERALPILQKATSWVELHAKLAACNMRLGKKGSGAVVWVGETAVKASSIHQGCSLGKLCKRLGEFVPAPEGFTPAPQPPKPVNTINRPEWEEYQRERTMPAPKASASPTPRKRKRRPRPTFKAWLRGRGLYRAASLWRYRQQIEPLPTIPLDAPQTEQPEALPALRDAIARYFNALQAERVRVTCIKMREDGTKQAMLLDKRNGTSIGFTQEELLARLPELLRLQARGENIYYTPLSETKHYILVDDMSRAHASDLLGDGYKPAVVLESSPGNYQCLLSLPKAKTPFDREIANRFTRVLNQKYGDANLSGAVHPHRAPLFENRKPQHRREDGSFPQVKLQYAKQQECRKAMLETDRIEREILAERQRQEQTRLAAARAMSSAQPAPAGSTRAAYYAHYANIREHFADADLSRIDSMIAVRLRATGHSPQDVAEALYECAPTIRQNPEGRDWQRYAERTVNYAFTVGGEMAIHRNKQAIRAWYALEQRHLNTVGLHLRL